MIYRLNYKNLYDVYEFILRTKDIWEDFYITKNKSRLMINNLSLIEKILKKQEVYAIDNGKFCALLIIVREKTFRPYIRILTENKKYIYDFMRFIGWNFSEELYLKVKKLNSINTVAQRFGWVFLGSRGQEILLKKIKSIKKEIRRD